jgi:hypothetical protein
VVPGLHRRAGKKIERRLLVGLLGSDLDKPLVYNKKFKK